MGSGPCCRARLSLPELQHRGTDHAAVIGDLRCRQPIPGHAGHPEQTTVGLHAAHTLPRMPPGRGGNLPRISVSKSSTISTRAAVAADRWSGLVSRKLLMVLEGRGPGCGLKTFSGEALKVSETPRPTRTSRTINRLATGPLGPTPLTEKIAALRMRTRPSPAPHIAPQRQRSPNRGDQIGPIGNMHEEPSRLF
jgi:hypothetical protein